VTTIYNPFAIAHIKSLSNETTEQLPTEKYIVHVGRAAKAKRHDVLFAALKLLESPIKLVCLTGNTKKLRKLSEKMGISERVILPGFTTNPYPWIKNAELLALSSDFEGLPTVLIEAIDSVLNADINLTDAKILSKINAKDVAGSYLALC